MTFVKIKGFKVFKDRHGKERCYHRASGVAVDLEKCPFGSAAFIAECERLAALQSIASNPKPGTLGLLIRPIVATLHSSNWQTAPALITSSALIGCSPLQTRHW